MPQEDHPVARILVIRGMKIAASHSQLLYSTPIQLTQWMIV